MSVSLSHKITQIQERLMSRILEVRFSDLEEEKGLCLELLKISQEAGDDYGMSFAHTYLGDYYIATNDISNTERHLLIAKGLIGQDKRFDHVSMRLYILLGLYYDNDSNEQSAIQYYLMAIDIAHKLGDTAAEAVAINNLAYMFQRHHGYEEALSYYEKGYQLQKEKPDSVALMTLLSNIVELSIVLERYEDAKRYLEEHEKTASNSTRHDICLIRNECYYYACTGDYDKAVMWAERFLQVNDAFMENLQEAFEHYTLLFRGMLKLKDQPYCKRFLCLMEEASEKSGLGQHQLVEDTRMSYILQFEPEEQHKTAYRRYYKKSLEFRQKVNKSIVSTMMDEIYLDKVMAQKASLETEQKVLQHQADIDDLTGIYNRRYLEGSLRKMAEGTSEGYWGVIMLDVDYFKEYNDNYGHRKGDEVLQAIAKCLTENASEGIAPCRYGGDEFTCLCKGLSDIEVACYIKAVQKDLEFRQFPHRWSRCADRVTLSIGYVNEKHDKHTDIYKLLQLADKALYATKASGRNSCTRKRVD